jgi:predicted ester cyclase
VATAQAGKASKKSARQVATAYFEAIANRDIEAMMGLWEPGGLGHLYGMASLRAPDGYRQWFGNLFRAFPDFLFEVTDIVAYGDKAAVRWRATGTFNGSVKFEGLLPTGSRIEIEGLDLLTIRDGLIRENRAYTNATEIARQLGAMPPAGSIGERLMLGAVNLRTAAIAAAKRFMSRNR